MTNRASWGLSTTKCRKVRIGCFGVLVRNWMSPLWPSSKTTWVGRVGIRGCGPRTVAVRAPCYTLPPTPPNVPQTTSCLIQRGTCLQMNDHKAKVCLIGCITVWLSVLCMLWVQVIYCVYFLRFLINLFILNYENWEKQTSLSLYNGVLWGYKHSRHMTYAKNLSSTKLMWEGRGNYTL